MVLTGGWWATVFPGLLMLITVLSLNVLSEGVSDAWAAPAARDVEVRDEEDPLEAPEPGTGKVLALPGLTEAAQRLRARARPVPTGQPILAVENLTIGFASRHSGVNIVDGISFEVHPGEVLGLVGESGCGKSLTALTVMGLEPKGARVSGQVRFNQRDLLTEPMRVRRKLLGHEMAMIYQDALSSLNPAMTIRSQLKQVVRRGGHRPPEELLGLVGLDPTAPSAATRTNCRAASANGS